VFKSTAVGTANTINISHFAAGVYILKLCRGGKTIAVEKIIKID
jgi:hypothetical protein